MSWCPNTFEVIADEGAVALGAIASEIGDGLIDGSAVSLPVSGFSAYGDSVRGVLDTLATAAGAWFVPQGDRLIMRDGAADASAIEDAGFAPQRSRGARRTRSVAAIDTVPKMLVLTHYDPARDYQIGLQRARRPGAGSRSDRIELPAAIGGGGAKSIAEHALARAEAAREKRSVALGWEALTIPPGGAVSIIGDVGLWRAQSWSLEEMVLRLDLVRLAGAAAPATASSGRVLASADAVHGPTQIEAFELPDLDDALRTAPQFVVAAAGVSPGWRRAALLFSTDGGARWIGAGSTAAPAILGTIAGNPGARPASLRDLASAIDVTLLHNEMALSSADDAALDAGANLALVGDELLQFGQAEQMGAAQWRLSRLMRGRRGTEAAAGRQQPGDRFVLIERDTLATIPISLAAIGTPVPIMASGVGDLSGPAMQIVIPPGISVRPPSPVLLRIVRMPGGSARLGWARRSRLGWRWIDGAEAPLGEERESYRVTLTARDGESTDILVEMPDLNLDAAGLAALESIAVRQLGTHGESPAATLEIG